MKKLTTICFGIVIIVLICINLHLANIHPEAPQTNYIVEIEYVNYLLGIEHIKEYEGFSEAPYKLNEWYVGYGFQTTDSINGMAQVEADHRLEIELNKRIIYVAKRYRLNGNKALATALLVYRTKSIVGSNLDYLLLFGLHDLVADSWLQYHHYVVDSVKVSNVKMKERCNFEVNLFYE